MSGVRGQAVFRDEDGKIVGVSAMSDEARSTWAADGAPSAPLADLTAEELVALGHGLRMVPGNVMVGREFLWQSEAFKALWEKVAHAINTRDDVAPYRKPDPFAGTGPTPAEEAMGDHVDA